MKVKILLSCLVSSSLFFTAALPEIVPVNPNDPGHLVSAGNMMGFNRGWGLQNQIEEQAPSSIRNSVIVLADGSVRCDLPEFREVCLPQFARNFTDEPYLDSNGHGDAFASAIIGQVNNGMYATGSAGHRKRVWIVPDKVLKSDGTSSSNWLRGAYQHAIDLKIEEGLDVIGVATSVSGPGDSNMPESLRLIRKLGDEEMALIAAAGNGGVDLDNAALKLYPAAYAATEPNVLAVPAFIQAGTALTPNSPRGEKTCAVAGWGQDYPVADPSDPNHVNTGSFSGTSPAAALVAGVYGEAWSYRTHKMAKALRRVKRGAVGPLPGVQFGKVNLEGALGDFPVTLLTTENGRALSFGAVTQIAEPIPNNSLFAADGRNRLTLFAENVDAPLAPVDIFIKLEDSMGRQIIVVPEHVGEIPKFEWITQIYIKLPKVPEDFSAGEVTITFTVRGHTTTARVNLAT